jgi:hypothetical protein
MAEGKNQHQVNVDFSKDVELYEDLEKMITADDTDRSKFIRKLVRQERDRRAQLPLPTITTEKKRSAQAIAA